MQTKPSSQDDLWWPDEVYHLIIIIIITGVWHYARVIAVRPPYNWIVHYRIYKLVRKIEFVLWPLWSTPVMYFVYALDRFGSSGIVRKYVSSCFLKAPIADEGLVMSLHGKFRISIGRELKRLGPFIKNDSSRSRVENLSLLHMVPCRFVSSKRIPGFTTSAWWIFQT